MSNNKVQKYDLRERTAKFGEEIIVFCKSIPKDDVNRSLISQVVRSGTSVGANYMEADAGESKKDFNHKIAICKKEAKETMHWMQMIAKAQPNKIQECRRLWKETHELALIFSAIIRSSNKNNK